MALNGIFREICVIRFIRDSEIVCVIRFISDSEGARNTTDG